MINKRSDKMHSRRGVGLVEVIVALAIIVIVSASAVTLITSHAKLEATTVATVEAASIAENAVECYRYGGYTDVAPLYAVLEDIYSREDGKTSVKTTEGWVVTLNSRSYEVGLEIVEATLTVKVSEPASPDPIIKLSYTKSVGGAG